MKLKTLRAAVLAALISSGAAYAATLGDARVNSYLNQPLDVEIDLIGVAEGEHQDLRLRIADREHFDRLGIVEEPLLRQLRFDVVRSGRAWLVRARTDSPVTEPFVDFPLQMSWPGGKMIKQITLLLDPPGRIAPATVRAATTTPARATPRPGAPAAADRDSYGPVRSGETLWPIAQRLKPAGITTRQMAMGLFRNNPQAFIDNDINLLRRGATLAIPSRDFIQQLDAREANRQFNELALGRRPTPVTATPRDIESLPLATILSETPSEEPASAPVDEPPLPDTQQPRLRIVKDGAEAELEPGSEQKLQTQLLATMEEVESNRITTGAIEDRLARLEDEIQRMQQLLELKDEQIAALQEAESAARDAAENAAAVATAAEAVIGTDGNVIEIAEQTAGAPITVESDGLPQSVLRQRPWYEEYVWVAWILIGLLGLTTLLLLFRRPQQQIIAEPAIAGIGAGAATTAAAAAFVEPVPAQTAGRQQHEPAVRKAADEARRRVEEDLPELEIASAKAEEAAQQDLSDPLLDELLDPEVASTEAQDSGKTVVRESDFDDDDLASWVAELENDTETSAARSANDEALDLEIPDLITEIDDELSQADDKADAGHQAAKREPDTVDDIVEDDTFTMSLDLARAYLEIGDQEGAKDMLQQALEGARNPEHRRQIEELLKQIG